MLKHLTISIQYLMKQNLQSLSYITTIFIELFQQLENWGKTVDKWEITRPTDLAMPLSVVMNYYLKLKFKVPNISGCTAMLYITKGKNLTNSLEVYNFNNYLPQTKLREGNVVTGVCLSSGRAGLPLRKKIH